MQPVPPRPAGQRPSAVQPGAAGSNQQGVLPALFGFQLGPGAQQRWQADEAEGVHQTDGASKRTLCCPKKLFGCCAGHQRTTPAATTATATAPAAPSAAAGQGYVEALTPEQQHQAFLSRLLLMLGSFVIMCLLLF